MLWITQNLATIIICAVLAVVTVLIVVHLVKQKKRGVPSCDCGCSGCPMSGSCHHGHE